MSHSNIVGQVPTKLDRPVFHIPDLTWSRPPYFPVPPHAGTLLARLVQDHYLILGGISNPEKRQLARHLAWLLSDHLGLGDTREVVGEWIRNSGLQYLEIALESKETQPIAILPDLEPEHLGYDLGKVANLVHQSGHYLLVTTDTPAEAWLLTPAQRRELWVEVKPSDIYDPVYLSTCLVQYLESYKGHLPGSLTPQTQLYEGMTLAEFAQRLEAPFHIRSFLKDLSRHERLPDRSGCEEMLDRIRSDEQALHRYLNSLDHRSKLLVVAIVLFEGLPLEAFFAASNLLLDTVWSKYLTRVPRYDGIDLSRMREAIGIEAEVIKFETRRKRSLMIHLIWMEHRELIKATLPILVTLAHESVRIENIFRPVWENLEDPTDEKFKASRWLDESIARNLFGSANHCIRFRLTLSETLGLLGRQSVAVVERSLLELAAHDAPQVREIAARAISSWRECQSGDASLSRLLSEWHQDIGAFRDIEELIDSKQPEGRRRDNLIMTIAQTVGQAVAYDPPNQMAPFLAELFESLSEETEPAVVRCFDEKTLPFVVQRHLLQQAYRLEQWLHKGKRIAAIARGLALAYSFQEDAAEKLITRWRDELAQLRPGNANRPPGRRETLWACIAFCHGYREDHVRAPISDAFRDWWYLLSSDGSSLVRNATLHAIYWRTFANFQAAEPFLLQITTVISRDESNILVALFTELYLIQRREMKDGETTFTHLGTKYATWMNQTRERTEVERVLSLWEGLKSHPVAQHVAARARQSFRERLDDAEQAYLEGFLPRPLNEGASPHLSRPKKKAKFPKRTKNSLFQLMLVKLVVTNKGLENEIRTLMSGHWQDRQYLDKLETLLQNHRRREEILFYVDQLTSYYRNCKRAIVVVVSFIVLLLLLI